MNDEIVSFQPIAWAAPSRRMPAMRKDQLVCQMMERFSEAACQQACKHEPDLCMKQAELIDRYQLRGPQSEQAADTLRRETCKRAPGLPECASLSQKVMPVLRFCGSGTIGDELVPKLAASFLKERCGEEAVKATISEKPPIYHVSARHSRTGEIWRVIITTPGTESGWPRVKEGSCDIAMASAPLTREQTDPGTTKPADEYVEHLLARDGIVFVVNSDTPPVTRLTLGQVREILRGKTTEWAAVGGPSGPIHLRIFDKTAGTRKLLLSMLNLAENDIPKENGSTVFEYLRGVELNKDINSDRYAIGFTGIPDKKTSKALAISDQRDGNEPLPFIDLTPASVAREDYPLSRPLYLYTRKDEKAVHVRDFIQFLKSTSAKEVMKEMPLGSPFPSLADKFSAPSIEWPDEKEEGLKRYHALTSRAYQMSRTLHYVANSAEREEWNPWDEKLDEQIAALLVDQAKPRSSVLLLGFADNQGKSPAGNERISLHRAQNFADRLLEKLRSGTQGQTPFTLHSSCRRDDNVPPEKTSPYQIACYGFGSKLFLGTNSTDKGRQKNRRVEIWIRPGS